MIQAGMSDHDACENAGTHALTLAAGRWTFRQTPASECGSVVAATGEGTFSVTGDVVAFNEPDAFGCGADYSYRFTIQGNAIRFQVAADDCEPRRIVFVTQAWTRAA
jgi:hypothetical protein